MATPRKDFKSSTKDRIYRRFSDEFKRKKVSEIISKKVRISEVCRAYEVTDSAIYKWIEKYSNQQKPERTIVESKSDTSKIMTLQHRIAELERLLGQKQIKIEYLEKVIDLAEESYKIDIKKKLDLKP